MEIPKVFNEDSLRADIVKVWGEHGAHIDVFDEMLKRLSALENKNAQTKSFTQRCTKHVPGEPRRVTWTQKDKGSWDAMVVYCLKCNRMISDERID